MRNVVTLSDVPADLHGWLKDEAKRRSQETGTRVKLYQVVVEALQRYRHDVEHSRNTRPAVAVPPTNNGFEYWLRDGRGPYLDVQAALRDLNIPESEKPKHNRWERLSTVLKAKIVRREKGAIISAVAVANVG